LRGKKLCCFIICMHSTLNTWKFTCNDSTACFESPIRIWICICICICICTSIYMNVRIKGIPLISRQCLVLALS
jgi:hypothetical protein